MKISRVLTLLIALALTLVVMAGCGGNKNDDNGGPDAGKIPSNNENVVSEAEAVSFSEFVIVYGDSDDAMSEVTSNFRKKIMALVGGKAPNVTTDKTGEAAKEILIGDTSRKSASGLLRSQFQISFANGKLAILGGSRESLEQGIGFFLEKLACKKGVLCAEGYLYTSPRGDDYKVASISIDGKKQGSLPVFDGFEDDSQLAIALDAIENASGIVCNQVSSADDAVIVFTVDAAAHGLSDEEWGLVIKSGKLYVVASTDYGKQDAAAYIRTLMSSASGDFAFAGKTAKVMTKAEFLKEDRLVIFPEYPEQIRRNYDFKVTVSQGDKSAQIPVYNHVMEYDLRDRGAGGDMYRRFSQFAFSGAEVRVDIKVGRDFSSYTVMPSAKAFKTEFKDGVISVFLDKPDYFAIRLDNDDNSIISIFADEPEFYREIPSKDDPDVYYVEGWHEVENGVLYYDSNAKNKTIYIAPGAVLNARIFFKYGAKNCKILGLGAIVDPYENIYEYDITYGGSEGGYTMVHLYGYDHVYDGPIILDARNFNITGCGNDLTVRNAKILSTMMTTDGVSLFNGSNYDVDHCFIYCGDNAIVYSTGDTPEKGSVNYNDITIGTTCAAIFPQGYTNDAVLTNIYVFRADSAIINCNLGSDGATHELYVKNIDAIDCTYTQHFFASYKLGTAEKVFSFENVSLPYFLGVTTGHNIANQPVSNKLVSLSNSTGNRYSDNYKVALKNVYIAGMKVDDLGDVTVVNQGEQNVITLENDGAYTPAAVNVHQVNYDFKGNVYIGQRLLSFNYDTIVVGSDFYLSADEIAEYLRTNATLTTVEKNGAKYVKASDLVAAGAAVSVETKNNDLYITPVYNGENLLLPDKGEISYYSEETCFNVDLLARVEDDEIIYTLQSFRELYQGGISRKITNEVKMYGTGTYKLAFEVRGAVGSTIMFGYSTDDADTALKTTSREIGVDVRWDEVEIEIFVSEADIASDSVTFYLKMNKDPLLTYFELRNITLVKVK